MARPAEVFVRPLTMSEGQKLQRITRRSDLGKEMLRGLLHAEGVSWQATPTWKGSNDPDFIPKMRRILDLYDHPPTDGRVICADEFVPLNLQPRPGRGWFARSRPKRLRATYIRWRNQNASPKTGFAINSKIRHPDYQPKAPG